MSNDKKPIVIKRVKKSSHGGHHGGSWKIAYADFMTAMMALFLVLWLIGKSTPAELKQLAEYFRMPLKMALTGGQRYSDSDSPFPGGGDDPSQQEGEVQRAPIQPPMVQQQSLAEKARIEQQKLRKLGENLNKLITLDPRLKMLRPHLIIDLIEQGLRIQIVDRENKPMFKVGSAEIEPHMQIILRAIAPILNDVPNKISVSGHTDDRQYATGDRGYSNWELSSDRANASRRELIAGGFDGNKVLRVVGMANMMHLKGKNLDPATNRRISLVVLNSATQEYLEHERDLLEPDILVDDVIDKNSEQIQESAEQDQSLIKNESIKTDNQAPESEQTDATAQPKETQNSKNND